MTFIKSLFGWSTASRKSMQPLYNAVVARGRDPLWYEGGISDSIDGRFEIITAVLAHVLLRLEEDDDARRPSTYLTELFVDDMDGQLRQIGVGDLMVGKHIGRLMAALGGRLGAYRDAGDAAAHASILTRNLGDQCGADAVRDAATRLAAFAAALSATPVAVILAGQLPELA